jgi:retron-type reverse transcriptase
MGTEQLHDHLKQHWTSIKQQLLEGTYHPQSVKRVEIPKPDGSKRLLGIPTAPGDSAAALLWPLHCRHVILQI